jgi:hypothetical protein
MPGLLSSVQLSYVRSTGDLQGPTGVVAQQPGAPVMENSTASASNSIINLGVVHFVAIGEGTGNLDTFIELLSVSSTQVSAVPAVSGSTPFLVAAAADAATQHRALKGKRKVVSSAQQLALERTSHLQVPAAHDLGTWPHGSFNAFTSGLSFASASAKSDRHWLRKLEQEESSQLLPPFDVNGDGKFSPADYVTLMHLGLLWTNSYANDAAPWLEAFKNITQKSEVTNWQLQSTDPEFLYAFSDTHRTPVSIATRNACSYHVSRPLQPAPVAIVIHCPSL